MFFVGFILCSAYSACLTSLLAVQQIKLPFTNAKELYESDYKLSTVAGAAFPLRYKVSRL
jgi:hypothetical protein